MAKRHLLLLPLLLVLLPGCAVKLTNLTPSVLPRSAAGYYPFEVAVTSQEKAVKWDTLEAFVRIGEDSYPMQRTPLLTNRWEALVPLPAETQAIEYRYEFRFQKAAMGGPAPASAESPSYKLRLAAPKPAANP